MGVFAAAFLSWGFIMYKKVLVPVSGEERCHRAMRALEKARQLCDGELIILHVTEPIPQTVGGDAREQLIKEAKAQGILALTPIIQVLDNTEHHFHTRVEMGSPADLIVQVADEENVDLIVMFTDGRDGFADMLLGSVTERVLRNTGVDLLAVRN